MLLTALFVSTVLALMAVAMAADDDRFSSA
jgi:hypothetical protein